MKAGYKMETIKSITDDNGKIDKIELQKLILDWTKQIDEMDKRNETQLVMQIKGDYYKVLSSPQSYLKYIVDL